MKHKIDIETWNRAEHFKFFKQFNEPYYGVTVKIDCSRAYNRSKELGLSFYSYYLHKSLKAVNAVENLRYRIHGEEVFVYDAIGVSATVLRDDYTFGFSQISYNADAVLFDKSVQKEVTRVKSTSGLFTTANVENVVHFSALPWVDFSSISQAFNFKSGDSCPKISVGKLVEADGKKQMSFALHVHHALVDGYHVGLFFEKLQSFLDE